MKNNYTNLDLLRSLAVLSVVVLHLWFACVEFHICADNPGVTSLLHNLSFTGVMFFFVHTCLVLMLSMHRAPATHRGRSFLIRRAFRIYPLCWTTILLVLATGLSDVPSGNYHALGGAGITANLFLVQNMIPGHPSAIGPLWSLPWEVQMYLVLPLFFAILRRFNRLHVVFALWLGATLLAIVGTQPLVPQSLHLRVTVFPPMFIAGMVAYKLLQARQAGWKVFPAWAWPPFVMCLFALQDYLVGEHSIESPYGAGVDASICLLLGLGVPAFAELRAGWIVHPAQQIAKYSYSIYLLHVPALMFVFRFLPRLPFGLKLALFLVLTALLSLVSFHIIEDPLIRLGKRLTQGAQVPCATPSKMALEHSPMSRPSSAQPFETPAQSRSIVAR